MHRRAGCVLTLGVSAFTFREFSVEDSGSQHMSDSDKVFSGSVPENYDRYLAPLIFETYAADMARRAASFSPSKVLETAAGTGVVTRALAPKLSADASYVVTDLNLPMLEYAASRQTEDGRISWLQADALALPFDKAAFDVVCCQFGAMFFPDRHAGYREALRVLKPGGRFVFSVWDRIEENVFADDVTNALARMFPHDPPRFLARTPHGYHDTALIRSELKAAGFRRVTIETQAELSRAASPRIPALAYCHGTPLRNEIEARDPGRLEAATDYAESAIAEKHSRGEVAAKIQAHIIVATA
jgi:ubiquinone/menaquinone biosynthesis C-methylase UbiE